MDHTAVCEFRLDDLAPPEGTARVRQLGVQSRRINAAEAASRRAAGGGGAPMQLEPGAHGTPHSAAPEAAPHRQDERRRPRDPTRLAAVVAAAESREAAAANAKRLKLEADRPGILLTPAPDGAPRKVAFRSETLQTLYKVGARPDRAYCLRRHSDDALQRITAHGLPACLRHCIAWFYR
jgi:hypothetical protein